MTFSRSGRTATLAVQTIAGASGTVNLDLSRYNTFDLTLTGNVTLTVSGAPAGGFNTQFEVRLTQDATGGRTVTWFGGITWPGGAPTMPPGPSASLIVDFDSYNGSAFTGFSSVLIDATTGAKGVVQLAGMLGGTAASPTLALPVADHTGTTTPVMTLNALNLVNSSLGAVTATLPAGAAPGTLFGIKDISGGGQDTTATPQNPAVVHMASAGGVDTFNGSTGSEVLPLVKAAGSGGNAAGTVSTYGRWWVMDPSGTNWVTCMERVPKGAYLSTSDIAAKGDLLVGLKAGQYAVLTADTSGTAKVLTDDGAGNLAWQTSAAFPSQTGKAGEVLTTDGTNVAWKQASLQAATFTANGSFTVPPGVTQVEVEVVGGGGGGGGGAAMTTATATGGGAGGAAGMGTRQVQAVTPGQVLTVTIGAGGSGGNGGAAGGNNGGSGGQGGTTTVTNGTWTASAMGGAGGKGGTKDSVTATLGGGWGSSGTYATSANQPTAGCGGWAAAAGGRGSASPWGAGGSGADGTTSSTIGGLAGPGCTSWGTQPVAPAGTGSGAAQGADGAVPTATGSGGGGGGGGAATARGGNGAAGSTGFVSVKCIG